MKTIVNKIEKNAIYNLDKQPIKTSALLWENVSKYEL